MKKLLLLVYFPLNLFAQNTIGLPDIINFSKQSYNAGLQNWDIKQDRNGVIYAANNEGLLSFDSRYWNLYPLPNKTIVRSVEVGSDNRIYVGGQDELGYFSPGANGKLEYHSLISFIPAGDRSFGDVWDIVSLNNNNVFFRTSSKIFRFTKESMAVFNAPSDWSYAGRFNGKLYAHDFKTGLMVFENNVMRPVAEKNILPQNEPVTGILEITPGRALLTTLKNGIFIFSADSIVKLQSSNNSIFENERIYAATAISKERAAIATNSSGAYVIDAAGNIVQHFSKTDGLQNNNVLSIFCDQQSNLWLGLDNGIDFIAYNSSIKQVRPILSDASGYTAIIHKNNLYAGTSSGLYSVALELVADLSFSKGSFAPVINSKGQVWSLSEINNQLLMGHHEGAYVINNNEAVKISSAPGFWNFVPVSSIFPTAQILGGSYRGLSFFNFINGQFIQVADIPSFSESSRFISIDAGNNYWVSHPYHGIFRVYKSSDGLYKTESYTGKNGLPSILNNHIFKIRNEVVAATINGIYVYDKAKDIFIPSEFYKNILGSQSVRYLREDAAGNIWFIHEKMPGVIDMSDKQPSVVYFPELNNKLLSGFEFIYPVNQKNIFLGGEKGFFHINYDKYKQTQPELHVHIRGIRVTGRTDSLVFGGYFKEINENQQQHTTPALKLSHNNNNIRFEFSSSFFGQQSNLEYSCRLNGLNKEWSVWSARTEKEYTNLPPGNYTFEVKVRNNFGKESAPDTYTLKILPPWYKSIWANIFYFIIACTALYMLYALQKKKFKQQQEKHEAEQKRLQYIHELEKNKTASELVRLQNEKLETEINFKNSELASSAMHLVKKGELLSKIKDELLQSLKGIGDAQTTAELKKIIKTLGEDEKLDKEWDSFSKHFDKVHSDFLVVLKEKHPGITANELKLCAYLRMNLSTKEIAQLMNISVRGVEISRYRLRKKLEITTEKSLFDYLIGLQEKK